MQYSEADELPDEVDARLGEIEAAMATFENRPVRYEPVEIARAGTFISIDAEGALRVERGFVRPEDEPPIEAVASGEADGDDGAGVAPGSEGAVQRAVITIGAAPVTSDPETAEEDETIRPLSDRLVTELTAHRTLALRDAVANDPHIAFLAVLHALCLHVFYHYAPDTCLEITAKQSGFSAQSPGLADTPSARAIDARHAQWTRQLPEAQDDLWDALAGFDGDSQTALFAHCASLTVNVVKEPWNRRPGALAHGELLANAVNLDMTAAGWRPTVDNYLGRVPKVRILEAVREAKGEQSAQLIDHLKKVDMAREAERLLEDTGWVPELLRLSDAAPAAEPTPDTEGELEALPAFLADGEKGESTRRSPRLRPSQRNNEHSSGATSVVPLLILITIRRNARLSRRATPFVRARVEDCDERFIRALKENLWWAQQNTTNAELPHASVALRGVYNRPGQSSRMDSSHQPNFRQVRLCTVERGRCGVPRCGGLLLTNLLVVYRGGCWNRGQLSVAIDCQ